MTAEALKELLQTPLALFVVMLLGSLASALKQVKGTETSLGSYLTHLPETLGALISNVLGFGVLVVTDQLNFASALGIGYVANSAIDLIRTGGRSDVVAQTTRQGGFARPMVLAFLLGVAVIATPFVQGCSVIGLQQPQTFNQRLVYAQAQVSALRVAATNLLEAQQITIDDAKYVLEVTDRSRALLETADRIHGAGQIPAGDSQLTLALGVLTELQSYLNRKQANEPLKLKRPN